MKVTLLSFGIAKEITGSRFMDLDIPSNATVGTLRAKLVEVYPRLSHLAAVRLAVNGEYADEILLLQEADEIAIIPPVSGG